jgi:hypothetical protein
MKWARRMVLLGLVIGLAFGTNLRFAGPVWADEPAPEETGVESTPTDDGSTSSPGTATPDGTNNTLADQAETESTLIRYYGCKSSYYNSFNADTSVTIKRCVMVRMTDKWKRLKVRATCKSINTGALTTCHFWWSQDPRGHVPTYRMIYASTPTGPFYVHGFSSVRAPALNATQSVAYSQWARDFNGMYIQGSLRNLGITLHGGIYSYPYTRYTSLLWDGGSF